MYAKAPICYQSLDEQGKFKDMNDYLLKTLGYQKKDLLGKSFLNILVKESKKQFKKDFLEFKKNGSVAKKEFLLKKKNNQLLWVSYDGIIELDEKGKLCTHCVFQDISKRKKAEEELKKNMIELQQFQNLAINRELEFIALKKRIKELEVQLKKKKINI